jgi:hypothetical protein
MNKNLSYFLIITGIVFSIKGQAQRPIEVPHERTINWKTQSDFANTIYASFANRKFDYNNLNGKGNTPRILLAKLLLKQDLEEVNNVMLKLKVWGISGSSWALNKKGDYDFTITPLTTILYLFGDKPDVLYPKTKDYLLNILLSESGNKFRKTAPKTLGLAPETENHILMTEGSRYLKNRWQMLHSDTQSDYDNVKNGMEAKILAYLERMKTDGLYEFNSIPYIGYTIMALLNLEAFASDKVRTEARNVLDYMNWTYALGSYQLRHYPPMRRLYGKASIQELTTDYHSIFMKSWLSYAPIEPFNTNISHGEVHALMGACMPFRPADKVVDLIFNKGKGYFVKLGHGKKSCPEIFTAGKHFLLSAGGANQGKRSLVVTRPTTLFLNDTADKLPQTFYLTGCGTDFMKWNNTGVYKNFACASGAVSVPTGFKSVANESNWSIYAANDGVLVAVYVTDNLGLMAVFEDIPPENLLKSLIQANPNAAQLSTQFQFPNGEKIEYDVSAPQNKWVIKAINGQAVDRDFDKWGLMNGDL